MKAMREELKAVERLRKAADQLARQERDKPATGGRSGKGYGVLPTPCGASRFTTHLCQQMSTYHLMVTLDCLMKQIILPVTVHLNIRLPLALLQPESADAPTGPEPEAHACQGCDNCGGCGKCQHEKKQA